MRYLYPRLTLAVLLLACVCAPQAFSQWYNYLDGSIITNVVDGGTSIWAASKEGGLMKIDKATNQITYYNRANSQLRSTHILSMIKDAAGNLWIGTEGAGLMKYDGANAWQHFYTGNSEIPSNDINSIAIDQTGNLWLGTDEGLAKFDGASHFGSWEKYNKDNSILPDNKVSAVSVASDGSIWAGTYTKGMVKIDGGNWTLFRKSNSPMPFDSVTAINANLDTKIWVGFGTGRAAEVKEGSSTWDVIDLRLPDQPGNQPLNRQIFHIVKGPDNSILFGTYTGLVRWQGDSVNMRYPTGSFGNEANGVFSVLNDNGTFYAGTRRGVATYKNGTWTTLSTSATGMSGGAVSSVLVDKTKTVWMGSFGGLTRFDGSAWRVWGPNDFHFQAVKNVSMDSTDPNLHWLAVIDGVYKRSGNSIQKVGAIPGLAARTNVVLTDHQGNVWAGTDNGLGKLVGGTWTTFTESTPNFPGGGITALAMDASHNIWVGSSFNGVAKYDGSSWTAYTSGDHPELGSGPVRSIAFGPNGDVYFATVDMGVAKLSGSTFSNHSTLNSPLPSDNVTAVAVDSKGALWIGTGATGIARYKDGAWNVYSTENSGMSEDRVTSISIGSDQKIWIGTESGGLTMYDEKMASGVANNETASAGTSMLLQNTPNPFGATTTLNVALPASARVRLSVLDARGQEVALVNDGPMTAGDHAVAFDASGLPSGVYFVRLVAGSHVESRTMVVSR